MFLLRFLLSAILVFLIANFLPGVEVAGFGTALIVALVLGLLNIFFPADYVVAHPSDYAFNVRFVYSRDKRDGDYALRFYCGRF